MDRFMTVDFNFEIGNLLSYFIAASECALESTAISNFRIGTALESTQQVQENA